MACFLWLIVYLYSKIYTIKETGILSLFFFVNFDVMCCFDVYKDRLSLFVHHLITNTTEPSPCVNELRRRKSQLEDIIYQGSKAKRLLDKNAVIELLKESTELLNVDPKVAIKRCITKIYANTDKSITVNMGVHLNGCGGRI